MKKSYTVNNEKVKQLILYGLLLIACFLLLCSNLLHSTIYGLWALMVMAFSIFVYFLFDISKRISLAFFILCIFTFLVSRQIIDFFLGKEYLQGFSEKVFITSCNCIFISCLCVLCGFQFNLETRLRFVNNRKKILLQYFNNNYYNMSKVNTYSFILAYISIIMACLFSIEQVSFVLENGYLSVYGYNSASANMASRFWLIGRTSVFVCLASNPSSKRMKIAGVLGAVEPCIQFLMGRRGYIVSYMLFFIFYIISYWKDNDNTGKQVNRKVILLGIVVLLSGTAILPFLYSYGYTRSGFTYEAYSNILEGISKFFYSQGTSYNVLGITVDNYKELPQTLYSLGIIKDIYTGVLNEYTDHTIDFAMHSSQLRAYVSYIDNEYLYLIGQGLGSSYIAEVFYDFHYLGLGIVNLLLGYILNKVKELKAINFIGLSLLLGFFYDIMMLPRAPLCTPFLNIFAKSTIATYILLIFFTHKRDKEIETVYKENDNEDRNIDFS